MANKSQEFKRVGECLYRNQNKAYFALAKVAGKQIKHSLKTDDLPLAKRRLAELRAKTDRLHSSAERNVRFDEFADAWLDSFKSDLKPKSWDRRRVAIVGLRPFFKGVLMKSVGCPEIDEWRRRRGAALLPRSNNIELETQNTFSDGLRTKNFCSRTTRINSNEESNRRRPQTSRVAKISSTLLRD